MMNTPPPRDALSSSWPSSWPPSWYAATAPLPPPSPPLRGDRRCDVCVVGGGYTGLATALDLAAQGLSVTVLEARRVGWGASGRNGGQVIGGYNLSPDTLRRRLGDGPARALWQLGEEAKTLLAARVATHAIDCDLSWGYLTAATKRAHMDYLSAQAEEAARWGDGGQRLVDKAGLEDIVRCERYLGGLVDEGSGQLHPLKYALGLARAAREAGAVIFEDSPVLEIGTGARPYARTAHGRVDCSFLVLAGNAYLSDLAPPLDRAIMPVLTYMLATEPLGEERAHNLIPSGYAVADANFVLNYYRRTPDHRLLFGGGVSYSGRQMPGEQEALARTMRHYFPSLTGVGIEHFWGGAVAITRNRLPQVGRLTPTTYYAHGYSGHGVALTGLCGRLLAEAITGQAGRFDVMAAIPHADFPGPKALRTPLLVLAMTWFRLKDAL